MDLQNTTKVAENKTDEAIKRSKQNRDEIGILNFRLHQLSRIEN